MKSKVSHVSLWFFLFDVPTVLEASTGGVKPQLLSTWLKKNKVIKKFKPLVDISGGLKASIKLLNEGYDYVGFIGYIPVIIARYFKKSIKNPIASSNKLICSEFVLMLDTYGEIPEWNKLDKRSTDPETLLENCGPSFQEVI
jgi:hypothetical protein